MERCCSSLPLLVAAQTDRSMFLVKVCVLMARGDWILVWRMREYGWVLRCGVWLGCSVGCLRRIPHKTWDTRVRARILICRNRCLGYIVVRSSRLDYRGWSRCSVIEASWYEIGVSIDRDVDAIEFGLMMFEFKKCQSSIRVCLSTNGVDFLSASVAASAYVLLDI